MNPESLISAISAKGEQVFQVMFDPKPTTEESKLNKTEKRFLAHLKQLGYSVGIQDVTLKYAWDCRYTCDFNAIDENGRWVFWEVKGFMMDDARKSLFACARKFRHLHFKLVKWSKSGWEITDVKP